MRAISFSKYNYFLLFSIIQCINITLMDKKFIMARAEFILFLGVVQKQRFSKSKSKSQNQTKKKMILKE